jgi:hypothetical protein
MTDANVANGPVLDNLYGRSLMIWVPAFAGMIGNF